MKKEIRIGLLFLALYNLLNFTVNYVLEREIPALHFFLGAFIGFALAEIVIGMLPESVYDKLKSHKRNIKQAIFNNKE
jgi:hypothetical protein